MKRFLKISLGLALILIVLLIGSGAFLLQQLPDPKAVKRSIVGHNSEIKAPQTSSETNPAPKEPNQAPAPEVTDQSQQDDKKAQLMMVRLLLEEDPFDIRVCENLGHPVSDELPGVFSDQLRSDGVAEAFRHPVKVMFQDEKFKSLMQDILGFEAELSDKSGEERSTFLEKVGFYGKIAMTTTHMLTRKKEFERLGDRATHLSVMAKLAALNPELASDSEFLNHCEGLQRSLIMGEKVNIKDERQKLVELIKAKGHTLEELKFDPDDYMKFGIQHTDKELKFTLSSKESEPAKPQ
jgi:hypothetical protein